MVLVQETNVQDNKYLQKMEIVNHALKEPFQMQ